MGIRLHELTAAVGTCCLLLVGYGMPNPPSESAMHPVATPATPPRIRSIAVLPIAGENYARALGSLDLFLAAWAEGDIREARGLLSVSQRTFLDTRDNTAIFLGETGGHLVGYEVVGTRQESQSAYEFDVWLYMHVMGAYGPGARIPRQEPYTVLVAQARGGSWLLQNIPGMSKKK